MAPLHLLGYNDQIQIEPIHDFFNQVMPLVLKLLSCNAKWIINGFIFPLGEDNSNKVWQNSCGHMMLLAPDKYHMALMTINGTILFVRSRWLNQGSTWLSLSWDTSVGTISHRWHHQYHHCISYFTIINMRCNITHSSQPCDMKHWYTFHIIGIHPWTNMPTTPTHVFPTTSLLYPAYRPNIITYINKIYSKMKL